MQELVENFELYFEINAKSLRSSKQGNNGVLMAMLEDHPGSSNYKYVRINQISLSFS